MNTVIEPKSVKEVHEILLQNVRLDKELTSLLENVEKSAEISAPLQDGQ